MASTRSHGRQLTLGSLEEMASTARNGFACMFSTSDEYEAALISERRAEGRYGSASPWPLIAFWGCAIAVACVVLLATV
jgi:hypothetical protein